MATTSLKLIKIKHNRTTNWPSCFATTGINGESTSIWNSTLTTTRTQPHGSFSGSGFVSFPNKFHPTQATTQFIQHITKYIQVMARKKKKHHIHFYQVHARNGLDTLSLHSAATFGPCSQLGGFCVLPAVVWIIEALALRDGSNWVKHPRHKRNKAHERQTHYPQTPCQLTDIREMTTHTVP